MDSVFFLQISCVNFLKITCFSQLFVEKKSFGFSMKVDDVGCCIDSLLYEDVLIAIRSRCLLEWNSSFSLW